MPKPKKQIISMRVLPGEPLDGTGRVCIHLFVPDSSGPFQENHVIQLCKLALARGERKAVSGPMTGRLACDRKRLVAPVTKSGVTTVTSRTDDPRAATCPKCIASKDYERMMLVLEPPKPEPTEQPEQTEQIGV